MTTARPSCVSCTATALTSQTSHAAILSSLLAILEPRQKATTATRPIIFVLDEFDLWTERDARQSFLYCLLDIVQSKSRASGGMCVIGLSARTDCIHLLEKRVKSRCQSRILHLLPPSSLDAFVEVGRAALRCDPAAIEGDDGEELARRWARAVDVRAVAAMSRADARRRSSHCRRRVARSRRSTICARARRS